MDDIWESEQREKCELYEEYTVICVRALKRKSQSSAYDTGLIYILVFDRFVITFHTDMLDTVSTIQDRLDRLGHITLSAGWFVYGILDHVVDGIMPFVAFNEIENKTIEELTMLFSQDSQNEILSYAAPHADFLDLFWPAFWLTLSLSLSISQADLQVKNHRGPIAQTGE